MKKNKLFQRSKINLFLGISLMLIFYFSKSYSQVEETSNPTEAYPEGATPLETDANTKDKASNVVSKTVPVSFESAPEYRYEPVGKRDPFRPFRDSKVGVGLIRTPSRPLDPLERFDVKTLQVVAIVWSNEKPKALIQDPDKGLHSVFVGQRIGKNEGYIAEIREGEVVVFELFDLNGKIIKEPFILCIDKTKGCGS